MKVIGLILALCLLSRTAAAVGPCNAEDNECLLRLTLQQTQELEAERLRLGHCQRSNDLLNEALKQEQGRHVDGGKVFVFGMLAGVVFVGLGATIALKAINASK